MEQQPSPEEATETKRPKLSRRARKFVRGWLERREAPVDNSETEHQKTVERREKPTRRQRLMESLGNFFRQKVEKPEPVDSTTLAESLLRPPLPLSEAVPERFAQPIEMPTPETIKPPPGPPPIEHLINHAPEPSDREVAERVVAPFRSAEGSTPPTQTVERVIERPNGTGPVAALLGLEFLARRRADRKIRKDTAKQLANQQKQTEKGLQQAEVRARSTAQEVHELKDQQRRFERKPVQPENRRPVEAVVKAEKKQPIEIPAPSKSETAEKLPVAERVVEQSEKLEQPDAVLEKMTAAAEKDIPVEAVYERRHEIKKETPVAAAAGGGGSQMPTPIGQTLQARLPQISQAAGLPAPQTTNSSPSSDSQLYKQAVKSGFWAAIVILIFMAIAFVAMSH